MGAVGERRVALRRGAGSPGRRFARVEPALERGDAGAGPVVAAEFEFGGAGGDQSGRVLGDRRVRRGGVDGPAEGRRRRVGVGGLVDRPDFEGVGAVGERRVALRRGAGSPGRRFARVEAALERGDAGAGPVVAAEFEFGGAGGDQSGRVLGDRRVRRGGVDGPGEGRRRRVGVGGLVDRPDFEGVGAVGERRVALRRGAGSPGRRFARVEAALERGDAGAGPVVAAEFEFGGAGGDQSGRVLGDRRVRRGGVDGPAEGRRRRVGVGGLVDRPDFEGVGAVGERRVALRRGASCPGRRFARVEAALERGDAGAGPVVAAEFEFGGAGGDQSGRVLGDRRVRRGGVDGPAEGRRRPVGVGGLVDRPDFEGVGAVGERRVALRRGAG